MDNKNNTPFLLSSNNNIPQFLVKTTLYCSVIALFFSIILVIENWLHSNILMALALVTIILFSVVNISYGIRNHYSLFLNTYIVVPASALTFILTTNMYGAAGTYWSFMLVFACYFILPISRALLFNILILVIFIPYTSTYLDHDSWFRFSFALVGTSLFAYFGMREIDKLHAILKVQAITDPLTGLFNRSLLNDSLEQSIAQSHRTGLPMTLISLDIDHFEDINDRLGHDIGDVVLKRLGELLGNRVRSSDRTFRVGGEEFLIILHNANIKRGTQIAEELRKQIETHDFIPLQNITISIGVAELDKKMTSSQWLKAADVNLYKAKEAGRNCVIHS